MAANRRHKAYTVLVELTSEKHRLVKAGIGQSSFCIHISLAGLLRILQENILPSNPAIRTANRLLTALPNKDREQISANCESIHLGFAEVLYRAGDLISYVYFPTESFISLVTPLNENASLEIGLVGNEGMLGITLILDVDVAPYHALVQGAGPALRISAASFLHILEQSQALHRLLKRYLYASLGQLAQTAACTRFHVVEARLARWLLMSKDRAHSDRFHVTHEFLAYMLGVRRAGVTNAAKSLKIKDLIRYHRGDIEILDPVGLEAISCACYRKEKAIYENILV